MKKLVAVALTTGAVIACGLALAAQPPERQGRDQGPGGQDGPPIGRRGGPGGGPGRFELGRVLPAEMRDALDLTEDQEKQLDQLESEVKEKLTKMLTTEQKKKLRDMRRRGPGQPPPPPGDGNAPPPPPRDRDESDAT